MRLVVHDSNAESCVWLAKYIIQRINSFVATDNHPRFVLGLSGDEGCVGVVYDALVNHHRRGEVSFRDVVAICSEEYVALDPTHECSVHTFLWDRLFKWVDFQRQNVEILDGVALDLDAECHRFEKRISAHGPMDILFLGIGRDGRLAGNEPGSSLCARSRVKAIAHDTRVYLSKSFGSFDDVPKAKVSVGTRAFVEANECVVLFTGVERAGTLKRSVEESVNHMCPTSIMQQHPNVLLVADEDATMELKVGMVRYFKSLQRDASLTEYHTYVDKHKYNPSSPRKRKA